jgi:hypothetical protein
MKRWNIIMSIDGQKNLSTAPPLLKDLLVILSESAKPIERKVKFGRIGLSENV